MLIEGYFWQYVLHDTQKSEQSNNPAFKALDDLCKRIRDEIEWYRTHATIDEGIRKERAQWMTEWLHDEGEKIVAEIGNTILRAEGSLCYEMAVAIQAFNELITVAKNQDFNDPENLEMFWRTINNTLPSLRWAFEDYQVDPENERNEHTDFMMWESASSGVFFGEVSGQDVYLHTTEDFGLVAA
jgi:hypothetical protein